MSMIPMASVRLSTLVGGGNREPMVVEVKHHESIRHFPFVTEREADGKFLSSSEWFITKLGTEVLNAIVSRYYKGIEGSHSMAVLEVRDADRES